MSGSFESVLWNECVQRLGLGLYSHPRGFCGMELDFMLTSREKSPLPEVFNKGGTHDAASRWVASPTHYRLSYSSLKNSSFSSYQPMSLFMYWNVDLVNRQALKHASYQTKFQYVSTFLRD